MKSFKWTYYNENPKATALSFILNSMTLPIFVGAAIMITGISRNNLWGIIGGAILVVGCILFMVLASRHLKKIDQAQKIMENSTVNK